MGDAAAEIQIALIGAIAAVIVALIGASASVIGVIVSLGNRRVVNNVAAQTDGMSKALAAGARREGVIEGQNQATAAEIGQRNKPS